MSRFNLGLIRVVLVGVGLTAAAGPLPGAEEIVPAVVQPQAPQPVCHGNCEKCQPQRGWFNAAWFDVEDGACKDSIPCPVQPVAGWQPRSTADVEREVHQILEIMHQLGQGVLAGTEFDENCCEADGSEGTCCASKGTCCAGKTRNSMADVLRQVAVSAPPQPEPVEPIWCGVATPCEPIGPVETLRQTARELEALANQLEDQEQYQAADAIRQTVVSVRQHARDLCGHTECLTGACQTDGSTGCAGKALNPHVTSLELDVPR